MVLFWLFLLNFIIIILLLFFSYIFLLAFRHFQSRSRITTSCTLLMLNIIHVFARYTSPFIFIFILSYFDPTFCWHFCLWLLLFWLVLLLSARLWFGADCRSTIFITLAFHLCMFILLNACQIYQVFLIISVT